jgi:transcriptional regulator with XRE-family HTH domain
MNQDTRPVHEILRAARRAKGITQTALASGVGCKQSAVSMFEAGRGDALSAETVARIAEHLGVDLAVVKGGTGGKMAARRVSKYCPVDECPSNVPYVVRGQLCFKPSLVEGRAGQADHCGLCGEILEERCPNEQCGAAISEGSFCAVCGTAYVTAAREERGPLVAWADGQRNRIGQIRQLSSTRTAQEQEGEDDTR